MDEQEMKTVAGDVYGKSLTGIGLNLLVTNVERMAEFLETVMQTRTIRANRDFAIIAYQSEHFMLHHDSTYGENKLLSILPEAGARGAGMELRFYHTDPDEAESRALIHAKNSTAVSSGIARIGLTACANASYSVKTVTASCQVAG